MDKEEKKERNFTAIVILISTIIVAPIMFHEHLDKYATIVYVAVSIISLFVVLYYRKFVENDTPKGTVSKEIEESTKRLDNYLDEMKSEKREESEQENDL